MKRFAILTLMLTVAACSRSDDAKGGGKAAVGSGAAPAGSPAAAAGSEPGHAADCPQEVELDCDKLVPKAVRDQFFDGESGKLSGKHECGWGLISVNVRPRENERPDFISAMKAEKRQVEGVGRAARSVADDIAFIPTHLDCEVRIHWENDLEKTTAFARGLDATLTKESIAK